MKNNTASSAYSFESSALKIAAQRIRNNSNVNDAYLNHILVPESDKRRVDDYEVKENRFFEYQVVYPKENIQNDKVVLLLHGLNEKRWNKYLPWAQAICEGTGSVVVLFPIAFHMQRVPRSWNNRQVLHELSEERKRQFPQVMESGVWNVSLSQRLHAVPQRMIWSGLQTYYDIIQFVEECKQGAHPLIGKNATFSFFGYSIGGYLAQTLKLTNHNNYFADSKVCLFCSGATLDRVYPVSKFILDSEASKALHTYFTEGLKKSFRSDALLNYYLNGNIVEGKVLYSLFNFEELQVFRESLLKKYSHHFYAIALKKDKVIPMHEVRNTLRGLNNDIQIAIEELDFDQTYTHEFPFPFDEHNPAERDKNLRKIFKKVCDYYDS